MQNYLARDDRGSILQVGSYSTASYINLDGTSTADRSTMFTEHRVLRIKSYGGDNWVTRFTPLTHRILTFTVADAGIIQVQDFDGEFEWTEVSGGWVNTEEDSTILYYETSAWFMEYDGVKYYKRIAPQTINPPFDRWEAIEEGLEENPVINYSYPIYYSDSASADVGMLMEDGEEITMLVYPNEKLGTIGGKLNIVSIGK